MADPVPTNGTAGGVSPRRGRILLVDDQPEVRDLLHRWLARQGYDVLVASTGTGALELRATQTQPIDALVTDLNLPDLSGREVAEQLTSRQPGLGVLFVSGDVGPEGSLPLGGHVAALQKPFAMAEFGRALQKVLGPGPGTAAADGAKGPIGSGTSSLQPV